jgi:hypothetical protein
MNEWQKLLNKKIDRKQFLIYSGLLLLSVTGVSGVIKNLKHPGILKNSDNHKVTTGFGSGPYGV